MPYLMRIVGRADRQATPVDGQWLVEYDPTRPGQIVNGRRLSVHLVCSPDRDKARRFADPAELHTYWTQRSGRPYPADKPLTAYTVEVEEVDR